MSTLYRPEGRTEDGAEERASGRLAPWSPNDAGSRRLWGPYPGEEPPVPLDWRPPPRFRDRVLAAVGVPAAVGTVLFALAVGAVVVIALLRSHVPDTGGEAETAQFGSEGAAESDGAGLLPGATDDPASVGASDGSAAAMVLVHVVGKVREPGVVELPSGARVQDAIEAAGGATSSAALSRLNLARPVLDGEQIVVSTRAGSGAAGSGGSDAAGGDAAGGGAAGSSAVGGGSTSDGAPIDLNLADASALEQLPRIGPALARRIIEWREAHGRFESVDQLLQVSGIGAKTLEGFRDRVRV